MKKLTLLTALAAVLLSGCVGCGPAVTYSQPYQYIQSPTGQQMVVCYDNSGTQFLLDYMLFTSLMNSGGYGNVMSYYGRNRSSVTIYNNSYSSWHSFSGRSYDNSKWSSYGRQSTYRSTNSTSTPSSSYRSTQPTTPSSTYRSTTTSPSSGSSYKPSGSSTYRSSSSGSTYRPSSPSSSSRSSWGGSSRSSSGSSYRRH